MTKKYTMQTINKSVELFDIEIFEEETARGMLAETLCCETREEAEFKAKVIFDEIKKGNTFTIVEKTGTRITFRIATDVDIKTEPLYRKADDELLDSFLTNEDKERMKALENFIKNTSSEEKDEMFNMIENNESSTD